MMLFLNLTVLTVPPLLISTSSSSSLVAVDMDRMGGYGTALPTPTAAGEGEGENGADEGTVSCTSGSNKQVNISLTI